MFNDQICEGMKVRAAEGEGVGKVLSADATGFVVEKGIFFKKDYFVSYDAVTEIKADEIFLSTPKDQLRETGAPDEAQPLPPPGYVAPVDFGDRDVLGARDEFGVSPDSVEPVGTRPTPSVPDDIDLELDRAQSVDATEPDGQPVTEDARADVKDAKDDKDVDKDAAVIDDEDQRRIPQ